MLKKCRIALRSEWSSASRLWAMKHWESHGPSDPATLEAQLWSLWLWAGCKEMTHNLSPDSWRAQSSKEDHTSLIFLVQRSPTAKFKEAYWCPSSMASTNLGKYLFSLYQLFTLRHRFWTSFHRDIKTLRGGFMGFLTYTWAEWLCFYPLYVLVFWIAHIFLRFNFPRMKTIALGFLKW